MAHDTGKLGRHVKSLRQRHSAYEARISELHLRGPLLLSSEEEELKRIKIRKCWLKLRIRAAENLLLTASAAQVCRHPVALAVASELHLRGVEEMQEAA